MYIMKVMKDIVFMIQFGACLRVSETIGLTWSCGETKTMQESDSLSYDDGDMMFSFRKKRMQESEIFL